MGHHAVRPQPQRVGVIEREGGEVHIDLDHTYAAELAVLVSFHVLVNGSLLPTSDRPQRMTPTEVRQLRELVTAAEQVLAAA